MAQQPRVNRPGSGMTWYVITAIIIVGAIAASLYFTSGGLGTSAEKPPTYSTFVTALNDGKVEDIKVTQDTTNGVSINYTIKGENAEPATGVAALTEQIKSYTVQGPSSQVFYQLLQDNVGKYSSYTFVDNTGLNFIDIILSVLPMIIMVGAIYFIFKSMSSGQGQTVAKSKARLQPGGTVRYSDVAAYEEEKQELQEVIDFLRNPKKYQKIGARIPRGLLLVGPPGTGKTLLARATAGEAGVPFYTVSGSDFLELYVGVGASRVRDMFATAKKTAPAIIFIDEIDAIGRQRGAGVGGGNDEREQTLNQILVEMDGFDQNAGILIIAATNRPDVLDPALLRPGRFDRQVTVNIPDVKGRKAILEVHARNKQLAPDADLGAIARRTPGFSGAELESVLNEAALLAARENREVIYEHDLDEAIDRVMMGPAKTSKKYNEHEKRVVAYHEAGHAVIGLKLDDASVVQKVTIIPRGQAGGYNLMMPKEETFLQTKKQLLDQITGYLGGRVAEEIIFGDITSGAYSDIQSVTAIARAMVTEYGMSDLGPIQFERRQGSVFLGRDFGKEQNFSEKIAQDIDNEVRKIVDGCYQRAHEIVQENIQLLHNIAEALVEQETLTYEEIKNIEDHGTTKPADKSTDANETTSSTVEENKTASEGEDNKPEEQEEKVIADTSFDTPEDAE